MRRVEFEIVTTADRPDLEGEASAAFRVRWPEFIFHDPLPKQYIARADEFFREFSILVLHEGRVAAGGWGVPFAWDGTLDGLPEGYRTALAVSVQDREAHRRVTAFSFMAAAVAKEFDKQGLARRVLDALISRASAAGLENVVAPVRPTWKHRYPQVAMSEYMTWTRADGLSIDPWIRTHQRTGARILKPRLTPSSLRAASPNGKSGHRCRSRLRGPSLFPMRSIWSRSITSVTSRSTAKRIFGCSTDSGAPGPAALTEIRRPGER
jgi:GNAT superfamily N-acetyltransferase